MCIMTCNLKIYDILFVIQSLTLLLGVNMLNKMLHHLLSKFSNLT